LLFCHLFSRFARGGSRPRAEGGGGLICAPFSYGLQLTIEDFNPDKNQCAFYDGIVTFIDSTAE
jgi:hypothetical protein